MKNILYSKRTSESSLFFVTQEVNGAVVWQTDGNTNTLLQWFANSNDAIEWLIEFLKPKATEAPTPINTKKKKND